MQLKIGSLLAVLTLIATLVYFLNWRVEVFDCISCVMKTGPGNPPQDVLKGCIALGLIILGVVVAIRLMILERQKK